MNESELVEFWQARMRQEIAQDWAEALGHYALLRALLWEPQRYRFSGDRAWLLACRDDLFFRDVAFDCEERVMLHQALDASIGARRPASALLDDHGRAQLAAITTLELERPHALMALDQAWGTARLVDVEAHDLAGEVLPLDDHASSALRVLVAAVGSLSLAAAPEAQWYGIWRAGMLVAAGCAMARSDGLGEISNVITHPLHRRRGYASLITATLVRWLWQAGCRPLLEIAADNLAAHACYQRLGFRTMHHLWQVQFFTP